MTLDQATQLVEAFPESSDPQIDESAIRAEVEAMDIGELAKDADHATLLRYLRVRSRLTAEITHVEEQTKALIKQLENRLAGLDYVFKALIIDIVNRKLTGKAKSIKTPFGTAGFRKSPGGLIVQDEQALIAACALAEDDSPLKQCYRLEPVVKKTELVEHYKTSGEVPDGCIVSDPEDKFFVS